MATGSGPKSRKPRKKNNAKQPIGAGKKGSGKRLIYKSGGGKKTLRTWRGMTKTQRKGARKQAEATGASLTASIRAYSTFKKNRASSAASKPRSTTTTSASTSRSSTPRASTPSRGSTSHRTGYTPRPKANTKRVSKNIKAYVEMPKKTVNRTSRSKGGGRNSIR